MFAIPKMHCVAAIAWWMQGTLAFAADAQTRDRPACDQTTFTPITRQTLDLAGQKPVTGNFMLPAGAYVLVEVSEQGVDVRVEASVPDAPARSFDSPLRRFGPQRILLEPRSAARMEIHVSGKERAQGKVILQAFAVHTEKAQGQCLRALRLLALGDAHYDRGQAISFSRADATPGNASEQYLAAVRAYAAASALLVAPSERPIRAHARLARAATFYQGLEDWAAAFAAGREAIDAYRLTTDEYGLTRARAMTAAAQMEVGRAEADGGKESLAHARRELLEIVEIHARRGERFDEALALNNAGLVFSYDRMFDDTLLLYRRAMSLYEKLGETTRQAQTLQNIALILTEMARPVEARGDFVRALRLITQSESPKLYADILNNLSLTELRLGKPDAALRGYSEALEILTKIQVPREQARSLQGIGNTYYSVGNRTDALAYFERALAMRSVALDPSGRLATMRAIADVYRDTGRFNEAIEQRRLALEIARGPVIKARVRTELARDLTESGALERAGEELRAVFATGFASDRIGQARALLERSHWSMATGNYEAAERDASEANKAFRALELQSSAFHAVMIQARAACRRGDGARALVHADTAVALTEELRRTSANPTLRASLWQPLRTAFDFRIQLATEQSACGVATPTDAIAALRFSEQSRNRTLADFQQRAAVPDPVSPGSAGKRRSELFAEIAARRARLEVLADREVPDEKAMQMLQLQIAQLLRQIDILNTDAGVVPGGAGDHELLQAAIETIRADTAVVEYWLGENLSYAWLIQRGKVRMVSLGNTDRIEAAARELHAAMRGFQSVARKERFLRARILFDLVVAPLPEDFRQARRVFFIPDGALHNVPFAALASGNEASPEYLLQKRDIAVSASILSIADDADRPGLATGFATLVVADPVYSGADLRVAPTKAGSAATPASGGRSLAPTLRGVRDRPKDGGDWPRLIASGREASAIVAVLAPSPVEVLSGFAANRDALLGRDLSHFRILHFATHAVADMESPQLSTLVLSTVDARGKPQVGEVFAGDLLYRRLDAELVVLSACDTAMGQAKSGEGLLGLRYAAHAAGARTVVASLWPVVDTIGEKIMTDFYESMSRGGQSPVAALSQAMRKAQRRWPDPALWSVFEISRVARVRESIH